MLKSILLVAALLSAAPASAPCELASCSCITAAFYGQTQTEFVHARRDRAERVVMGNVMRLDTLSEVAWDSDHDRVAVHPIVARVSVRQVWRGPLTDTMTVMLSGVERRSSCDLTLRPGKTYLIFATRTNGSLLATRACSGTVEESAAAATLKELGPGTLVRP